MNRDWRRKYYKKHKNKLKYVDKLESWEDFNNSFIKQQPYVNYEKNKHNINV